MKDIIEWLGKTLTKCENDDLWCSHPDEPPGGATLEHPHLFVGTDGDDLWWAEARFGEVSAQTERQASAVGAMATVGCKLLALGAGLKKLDLS